MRPIVRLPVAEVSNVAQSANECYLPNVTAENDLSSKQCYFVEKGAAAGQVDVPDSAGDLVLGVLCNKPTAGQAALVQCAGVAKVKCGGAISYGDRVGTTNAGKAVAKAAADDLVAGIALEDGVDGDIISVLLTPGAQRSA